MKKYFLDVLKLQYADFKGRASRRQFWMFVLYNVIAAVIVGIIGGIVGLNSGLIYNCSLNDNFGNAGLSYLGGIASVNIRSNDNAERSYEKVSYYTGTIQNCRTAKNKTVSGKHTLGGSECRRMG